MIIELESLVSIAKKAITSDNMFSQLETFKKLFFENILQKMYCTNGFLSDNILLFPKNCKFSNNTFCLDNSEL